MIERRLKSERYRILKWYQAVKQKRVKKEEALKELAKIYQTLTFEEAREYYKQMLIKLEQD